MQLRPPVSWTLALTALPTARWRILKFSILERNREGSGATVDADAWARASYRPTPTIIEAARALYAQHSVEAIARYDAGAQNLYVTSRRIEELVDEARAKVAS